MGQQDRHRRHRCDKDKKVCKDKCKPITKRDFGCHKNETFVIRKPGYYCLKEDICFRPTSLNTDAITIDSDDVVLDLCGHELKQSNDVQLVIGIHVLTGHRNVTILGSYGSVRNFTQLGIYVEGGQQRITLGDDTQLNVNGCGGGGNYGMAYEDPVTGELSPIITGGIVLGETKFVAYNGFLTYHGIIETLLVKNVFVEFGTGYSPCMLGNGSNYVITGSSFSNNRETRIVGKWFDSTDDDLTFATSEAIIYRSSPLFDDSLSNVVIEDCFVNNNSVENNEVEAYECATAILTTVKDLTVRRCQFSSNSALSEVYSECRSCVLAGVQCCVVEDSEFCNNVSNHWTEGLHFSGFNTNPTGGTGTITADRSVVVRNCISSNNLVDAIDPTDANLRGYVFAYVQGGVYDNCLAENNRIVFPEEIKDAAESTVTGFRITGFISTTFPEGIVTSIEMKGCKAFNNRSNSGFGESTGVFLRRSCVQVEIRDSIFGLDPREEVAPNNMAQGILADGDPTEQYINIDHCTFVGFLGDSASGALIIESNNNIIQNSTFSGNTKGIFMTSSFCNVIKNNLLTNNAKAIVDDELVLTNLIVENKAFNSTIQSYPDYIVEGDSKSTGSVGGPFPPATGTLCVNTDFTKDLARGLNVSKDLHKHILQDLEKRESILSKLKLEDDKRLLKL